MKFFHFFLLTVCLVLSGSCSTQKQTTTKTVYKSESLVITQITPGIYQHTSYLQTESFGNVPCNGMIVLSNNESAVIDTPVNDETSEKLIQWIQNHLKSKITSVVSTHFHDDCVGGLNAFHKHNIPSVAYFKTIAITKEKQLPVPQESFDKSLKLTVGNEKILLDFFGEGHTKDNIVAYVPSKKVLFGGCMIKELNAGKGNLEDANEQDWAQTVQLIKDTYPDIKTIIPGHGSIGNQQLLDYTIKLFTKK